MDQKRQRIDPLQCILNLDLDEFHSELLRAHSNSDSTSFSDLQRTLHSKFLDLQELLYCTTPRTQSSRVFEHLSIEGYGSNVVEIEARETTGDAVLGSRVTRLETFEQIRRFLEKGHYFGNVTIYHEMNHLVVKIFEKLAQQGAFSHFEFDSS